MWKSLPFKLLKKSYLTLRLHEYLLEWTAYICYFTMSLANFFLKQPFRNIFPPTKSIKYHICQTVLLILWWYSSPIDFFGTGFSPLIFDPSGIREISLIIEDDDMLENNEQMSIFLSNALPAEVIIDPDTIEIIITDNDRREYL